MYFNFFHLLATSFFYYSIFFFSFTKFLLKSFPGFFNDKLILLVADDLPSYLPHKKINRCLTDINRCLTDISQFLLILTDI